MTQQLDPVCLGLGASYGYSGDDLTNPRAAVLRGEVPYLPVGAARPDSVLELRIHGVGGAPPPDNLETPDTLQVAGDSTAGSTGPGIRVDARQRPRCGARPTPGAS